MTQMSGVSTRVITVFGGSGFIGRHVVRALARRGWRIKVAVRRPDLAFHLPPLGMVGQINAVQANVRYPESVAAATRAAEAVINLVGILQPTGRQSFDGIHVEGARVIAQAAREAGVRSMVHMSAIGADAHGTSDYARSKALGEQAACDGFPGCTVLRPSIVFGPEDNFFNRFAALARFLPVMPLIGGGRTRFQPVFVGDVAEAAARLVEAPADARAQTLPDSFLYELGGPEIRTFRELLAYICRVTGRRRPFVTIPFGLAHFVPALASEVADRITLGKFPQALLMTRDQVKLLAAIDNVVSDAAIQDKRTLQGLGINPTAIDAVVPGYLYRFRKTGQFDRHMSARD